MGLATGLGAALWAGLWAAPVTASPASPPSPAASLPLADAIALAFAHDPNIELAESQVDTFRGLLLGARGDFDPVVGAAATRTDLDRPGAADSETLRTVVGVSRRLRSGLLLAPEVDLLRTGGDPVANDSAVTFELRQPLLRGRGRRATAAGERAAERDLAAARLDLEHTVAERLLAVVSRYWTVAAARADLEILETTEASSQRLLETTRRLIEADITPAAELVLLEADLAAKESDRIAGERSLFAARRELEREIGLPAGAIGSLPLPGEDIPSLEAGRLPAAESARRVLAAELVRQALGRRADLLAARTRQEASEILLAAAENGLEPQLDLVVAPSYSGLAEGAAAGDFFDALLRQVPGLSTRFGLALSWPVWNRRAEGDLLQAQAALDRGRSLIELAESGIGADVPTALDAVRSFALQVERAERAVTLFSRAVDNEEKKLRGGSSTLLDVLLQRDRLTASRRQLVAARLALALALLDLRFETATLLTAAPGSVPDSGGGDTGSSGARIYTVRVEDVTTLPDLPDLPSAGAPL